MKILVTTSTFPVSDTDKVPSFVRDQVIYLKKKYPNTKIIVHAPHNYYSKTTEENLGTKYFREVRYHYFLPHRWELLTGRGIMPALKQNKLLYFQIPFLIINQFFSLLMLVRREKPEIIYAHWFTPQAMTSAAVSRLTKTPFIFTTHASDVEVLKKIPFSKILVRSICKQAIAFTAVSKRTTDRLKVFFKEQDWQENFREKMNIIPMGVETRPIPVESALVPSLSEKFDTPGKKTILFIGRLAQIKGINYLLEAFAQLPVSQASKLQLIIAGDGQEKKSLETQAKLLKLNNVKFTGYIHGAEKNYLFKKAEMVCVPSIVDEKGHMEGLPVVIMEGLAAGKIILASDASGAEAILKNKETGFIFKQKSPESLAAAIITAVNITPQQRKKIKSEAIKLAKQFDWDTITEKHYQIFRKSLIS